MSLICGDAPGVLTQPSCQFGPDWVKGSPEGDESPPLEIPKKFISHETS